MGVSSCIGSERTDSVADPERMQILQSHDSLTSCISSWIQVSLARSSLIFKFSTGVNSALSSLSPSKSKYPGEEGISPSTSEDTSSGELCADSYVINRIVRKQRFMVLTKTGDNVASSLVARTCCKRGHHVNSADRSRGRDLPLLLSASDWSKPNPLSERT